MPWSDRLLRSLRRADHRAVAWMVTLLGAAIAMQALLVWAFVAVEGLEAEDRALADALRQGARATLASRDLRETRRALEPLLGVAPAVRIVAADGRVLAEAGAWPRPEQLVPTVGADASRPLRDFRRLGRDRHLFGETELGADRRLELSVSLGPVDDEVREIGVALVLLAGVSGVAALLLAGLAISRAFAPLRRSTRILEGLSALGPGQRLPTRGTGDPVDRHTEALNRVLADAEAAFERLRAFSADVAHELRTPLNRLQNLAEVALLSGDVAELKPTLERVHAAAQDLSRTVQSLLLLAELDEGRVEPRTGSVDLDAWLARMVELYGPLFEERGSVLERRGRVGTVVADVQLLDRVLSNLLDNASRHGASGGRAEIRGRRSGSTVAIEVDDAGPGIPEEMRERIFDRFARLDRARAGPGTGLGLALARACARLSGGDLRVGESRLGGACFEWELPAAPPTDPGVRRASPPARAT